jgi:AcrR family transcriptional regulator
MPASTQARLPKLKKLPPRTRGRPRLEDVNKLNHHILLVARATFFELGYTGATLDIIAQRARVSKSTFYTRFQDKLGLFKAVMEYSLGEWTEGAKFHEADQSSTLEETIRHHVAVQVRAMADSDMMRLARVIMAESHVMPELTKAFLDQSKADRIDVLVDKIRRYADKDGVPCRDPESAAVLLRSMVSGWVGEIQAAQQPFGTDEQTFVIERAVQVFMASRTVW